MMTNTQSYGAFPKNLNTSDCYGEFNRFFCFQII